MIRVLDDLTINKIAAGEVIERPVSVVKELVENSIDAGSKNISVEIKGGGIDYIRVTDNGKGIPHNEVKTAFLRHATSKIVSSEDLFFLNTLGFRGEALASIASVSHTEMITKTQDETMGTKVTYNGGNFGEITSAGTPEGTTIIVRDLFYNVPARKKFLNSSQSEGTKIVELMEELVLCNPDISFQLIVNGNVKIQTNGSGNVKDIIFRLYGKETFDAVLPVDYEDDFIRMYGFIAKPEICRPSRSGENYFINGRYVKNEFITRGIEEGFRNFLMQHKYPFVVLFITLDSFGLDVNVHPAKAEIRITNGDFLVDILSKCIRKTLSDNELIPKALVFEEEKKTIERAPEPFEKELLKNSYVIQKGYDSKKDIDKTDDSDKEEDENDKSKEFAIDFDNIFKKEDTPKSNNFMNQISGNKIKSRYDKLEEKLKNKDDDDETEDTAVIDKKDEKDDESYYNNDEIQSDSDNADEKSLSTNPDSDNFNGEEDKDSDDIFKAEKLSYEIVKSKEKNLKETKDIEKPVNENKELSGLNDNINNDKYKDLFSPKLNENTPENKEINENVVVEKTDSSNEEGTVIIFDDNSLNAIFNPGIDVTKSNNAKNTTSEEDTDSHSNKETVIDKKEDEQSSKVKDEESHSFENEIKNDKENASSNEELKKDDSDTVKDELKDENKSETIKDELKNENESETIKDELKEKKESEPVKDDIKEISDKDVMDSVSETNIDKITGNDIFKEVDRFSASENNGNGDFRDNFKDSYHKENKVEFRVKTDGMTQSVPERNVQKNINTDIFHKVDKFGSSTVKKEVKEEQQTLLFSDKTFDKNKITKYEILGQIFDTYWLISVENEMLIMDQHAAHEKVLYEKLIKKFKENRLETQTLIVPQVATLGKSEMEVYDKYKDEFKKFGFIINDFGDKDLFIRGVPTDLFGSDAKSLFMDIMSELMSISPSMHVSTIEDRIATRACKAAIKGNQKVSKDDCKLLLDYLFTLDNPYHCPHGRPTMIKISKNDLEKMFKRIV